MYAMQYTIPLPADYDMQIIRDRVTRTGHLFDGFSGLMFKAFLIREQATGAPVNEYAPFYLWNNIDGMRAFCWGELGFSAIVRDFGRRPIHDWTVVDVTDGPCPLNRARSMSITPQPLPADVAPAEVIFDLTSDHLASVDSSTVHKVAAVDVTSWTLLLAELSADSPEPNHDAYEVLHVSSGFPA